VFGLVTGFVGHTANNFLLWFTLALSLAQTICLQFTTHALVLLRLLSGAVSNGGRFLSWIP
jgi:hypothetical protein